MDGVKEFFEEGDYPFYCIDDPNLSLITTTERSFQILIEKCKDNNSKNVKCSSDEEIDKWL